jgi:hypothetical protein
MAWQDYIQVVLGGPLDGVTPPPIMSGKFVLPDGYFRGENNTVTLTAARYYYALKYISRIETFSGVKFHDSGTGNNGKKVKIAAFSISSLTGALSAVAKNFGEVTLDATAGIETLASSWTPTYIGWHVLALTSNSNPVIYSMARGARNSEVGQQPVDVYDSRLGTFATDFFSAITSVNRLYNHGDYAAGTYPNFPEATPLAPTASIVDAANTFPLFGLYK